MRPLFLAVLAGCSDYQIVGGLDPHTLGDTDGSDVIVDQCSVATPPYTVEVDPQCAAHPTVGSFTPVVKWAWSENPADPGYDQVMVTPIVVDLDGDGVPEVVFTAFSAASSAESYGDPGALVAISGKDGRTLWSVRNAGGHLPYGAGGVAAGDLDGDGAVEIVVAALDGLLCLAGDGSLRWSAPVPPARFGYPAIADLDGDGQAEVIFGGSVVSASGRILTTGTLSDDRPTSFAVDLDEDGKNEVIDGPGFTAVADLDLDGDPEIVRVPISRVEVYDGDTLRWSFALPSPDWGGGPPTIADVDGDGIPEIGVASKYAYRVFRADGTVLWERPNEDTSSAMTGSSVFDFEGDGRADVVYADERTLYVWDGPTGEEKLAWHDHTSGTLYEYPVIVDLDGDDAAEIVIAENDFAWGAGRHGITVIADEGGTWMDARPIWNQHAYFVTNVEDDGGIPASIAPNWASFNDFRDNDPLPGDVGEGLPSLALDDTTACEVRCEAGEAQVWAAVSNRGAVSVDTNVEMAGQSLAVGTIDPGRGAWAGPFTLVASDFEAGPVEVRAVHDGQDCDPADDTLLIDAFPCRP